MMSRKKFRVGDIVRVRYGLEDVKAVVTDIRGDRVFVRIQFDDSDEPVRVPYRRELVSA